MMTFACFLICVIVSLNENYQTLIMPLYRSQESSHIYHLAENPNVLFNAVEDVFIGFNGDYQDVVLNRQNILKYYQIIKRHWFSKFVNSAEIDYTNIPENIRPNYDVLFKSIDEFLKDGDLKKKYQFGYKMMIGAKFEYFINVMQNDIMIEKKCISTGGLGSDYTSYINFEKKSDIVPHVFAKCNLTVDDTYIETDIPKIVKYLSACPNENMEILEIDQQLILNEKFGSNISVGFGQICIDLFGDSYSLMNVKKYENSIFNLTDTKVFLIWKQDITGHMTDIFLLKGFPCETKIPFGKSAVSKITKELSIWKNNVQKDFVKKHVNELFGYISEKDENIQTLQQVTIKNVFRK